MSTNNKQMLVNYIPGEECRIAITSGGRLEEFHSEKTGSVTFVGNIYVGRVQNVEPSIQAAFVDFGLESNGFLHISDLHPQYFPGDDDKTEQIGRKTPRRERPPIQHCLKRGQEIIVQVLKEGINTKGPTLTSYLSIPGRYLVMLPDMDRVGVSRRVEDEELRREMKDTLDQIELPEGFGFILRTAGIGRGKMELKRDLAYLMRLWKDIERRRKSGGGGGSRLLYAESDLLMRSLRDFWTADVNEIIVDNDAAIRRAAKFMKIVSPRSGTKLLHYDRSAPMFHTFGIEEQIAQMHAREVPLPSGGSLVIDETEAMIAIDVNSGKSRSAGDAETTAFRTNREAVDEICRQLRLRDVGGLVLCDLIDMMKREHRRAIEAQFKENLKSDRSATKVLPISQFGIVEMTRQRQRGSLRSVHFAKCPACHSRGVVQRPESVASDAIRSLAALLDQETVHKVEMVVSPSVAGALLSSKRQALGKLEFRSKKHVDVRISEDVGLDRVVFYAYEESGADIDLEKLPRMKAPKDLPVWAELSGDGGEDWSVDSTHEQSAAPEQAWAETEVDALENEPMLVDITEEELEEAEQMQAGRLIDPRQRGSKGGQRGEPRGAPRGGQRTPPPQQPAARAGGGGAEEDERGGRRKRRRRRGKGGDRGGEPMTPQPVAPPGARGVPSGGTPIGAPPPARDSGPRGDSWDLAPNELAGANGAANVPAYEDAPVGAPGAGEGQGEDLDLTVRDGTPMAGEGGETGAGKKRRRGRRGGRRRRKGGGPDGVLDGAPAPNGAPALAPAINDGDVGGDDDNAPDDAGGDDHESHTTEPGADGAPGGGGKKRRRRRRRGKGDGNGASGSPAGARGGAPASSPSPQSQPALRPSPPLAAPAGGPKPVVRTLYGAMRRKLNPGEVARAKREE